jgi:hypothetical protein
MRFYIAEFVAFVVLATAANACANAVLPGAYGVELEACLTASRTCDEYVACRGEVAKKYSRTFTGSCRK